MLLLVFLLPFTQSCTDLEEEVFSDLTSDNFPTTEQQFIAALGATYTSLYFFGQHNSFFSLLEVSSDEICIPQRGSDWFDGGMWLRVHRHTLNASEESVLNGWNALYGGINDCNRVVDLFENLVLQGSVSQEDAAAFIGEVKVLRALYYYWLMDGYGNIPIVTSFAGADPNPPTVPRAQVFAFIEGELNENVPNLSREKDATTYGRFNYWAGRALQAKLYLNAAQYTGTARWDEALAACDDIINSGLYSLENNYFTNFNTDNSGSNENILVIPYDQNNATGFNLPQMTLHYSSQATFELQQQPWNGYCTLQEFYESYEDVDGRKGEWGNQQVRGNFHAGPQFASNGTTRLVDSSAEPNDPDGQPLTFTPEVNQLEPGALRQAGARVGKFEFALGATPDLSNDFPILRFSDILLMKAEILVRENKMLEDALMAVNEVRRRAGGIDEWEMMDLTLDNLLAERGREMFYEGWRRQDLIRFGKFTGTWWEKPASAPERQIFPIPQQAIGANPNLVQNPGY